MSAKFTNNNRSKLRLAAETATGTITKKQSKMPHTLRGSSIEVGDQRTFMNDNGRIVEVNDRPPITVSHDSDESEGEPAVPVPTLSSLRKFPISDQWKPVPGGRKPTFQPLRSWRKEGKMSKHCLAVPPGRMIGKRYKYKDEIHTCGAYGIPCGPENNLLVLDSDMYKLNDDPDAQQAHLFTHTFGSVDPEFDTLTVETASGGRHWYFLADPDIPETLHMEPFDLLSGGGMVIGPGSNREGAEWSVIKNRPIAPLPPAVKQFILEHFRSGPDMSHTSRRVKKSASKKQPKARPGWRYNLSEEQIREVVSKLPDEYWTTVYADNGKPSWLRFTTAMKQLDRKDIWDEVNRVKPNYNQAGNEARWNELDLSRQYDQVITLLSHAKMSVLRDYHKLHPLPANEHAFETFDEQYLGYDRYSQGCETVPPDTTNEAEQKRMLILKHNTENRIRKKAEVIELKHTDPDGLRRFLPERALDMDYYDALVDWRENYPYEVSVPEVVKRLPADFKYEISEDEDIYSVDYSIESDEQVLTLRKLLDESRQQADQKKMEAEIEIMKAKEYANMEQKIGQSEKLSKYTKALTFPSFFVKSDCGTGKTRSFLAHACINKLRVLAIVSRKTLGQSMYQEWTKENDPDGFFLTDLLYYKDFPGCVPMKNGVMEDSLITTIDSLPSKLWYAKEMDLSNVVVFMDEYNSLIEYLITTTTLKESRSTAYLYLVHILKNCKQIICTDADMSDVSMDFMKLNGIDRQFLCLHNTHRKNNDIVAEEVEYDEVVIEHMKVTEKWIAAFDTKAKPKAIWEKHFPDAVLIVKEGCYINGVLHKDYMPDFDEHPRIMFSPKVTYGVDSRMRRQVFGVYQENTITPRGMVQQFCRCRNIEKLSFHFYRKRFQELEETLPEVKERLLSTNAFGVQHMKFQHGKEVFESYFNMLARFEYDRICYNTNPFAHCVQLMEQRGWQLRLLHKKREAATIKGPSVSERVDRFDPSSPEDRAVYERELEALHLSPMRAKHQFGTPQQQLHGGYIILDLATPIEDIPLEATGELFISPDEHGEPEMLAAKYAEQVVSDEKRDQHFNIQRYFMMDQDKWLQQFDESNTEFTVNKVKDPKFQMFWMTQLRKLLVANPDDPCDITTVRELSDEQKTKFNREYRKMFSTTRRENVFGTIGESNKSIKDMYHHFFGKQNVVDNWKGSPSGFRPRINGQKTATFVVDMDAFRETRELRDIQFDSTHQKLDTRNKRQKWHKKLMVDTIETAAALGELTGEFEPEADTAALAILNEIFTTPEEPAPVARQLFDD